jgi:hypothetical protein
MGITPASWKNYVVLHGAGRVRRDLAGVTPENSRLCDLPIGTLDRSISGTVEISNWYVIAPCAGNHLTFELSPKSRRLRRHKVRSGAFEIPP